MREVISAAVFLYLVSCSFAADEVTEETADEWDKFNNFVDFDPKTPARLQGNKAVTSFLKHVNTYKLNVTILLSHGETWSSGDNKELNTFQITLANKEHLKETSYNKDVAYSFLKLAEEALLPANARFVTLKNNPLTTDFERFVSNKDDYVPVNLAYNTMFNVQEGVVGYIPVDPAHWSRYNFFTESGAETEILFGDVDIEMKKSENFSDEELAYAKETIRDYATLIEDNEDTARMIGERFDKKYPQWNWNVFVGGGKFATTFVKYATYEVYGTDYTVIATEPTKKTTE